MHNRIHDSDADIVLQPDNATVSDLTVDELITAYQVHAAAEKAAHQAKVQIAARLAMLAPQVDNCRTVRIRGQRLRARIEYPDDAWDQSKLKECWHAFPRFRDEYLTISTLRVRLREYAKGIRTTGPADYATFLGILKDANRGPVGLPRITIEEGGRP
jgi:hypothetical protein